MRQRLKFLAGGLVFALLAQTPLAYAQNAGARLERLNDIQFTRQLETRLAELLARNDRQQLQALKTEVEKQDGFKIAEIFKWIESDKSVVLQIGACHFAGMGLRRIIAGLADGSLKPAQEAGVWIVNPGELDELYSRYAYICEQRRGLPISKPRIGNANCVQTGEACPRE